MATYESRKPGPNEFSDVGFPIQVQVVEYDHSDLDAAKKFYVPIEAGIAVIGVAHQITEAFAGGTPQLEIGDSSDADEYIGDASIVEANVNDFVCSMALGTDAAKGKYYPSTDYIVVLQNLANHLTAGAGKIFVFYVDTRTNWRTKNDL